MNDNPFINRPSGPRDTTRIPVQVGPGMPGTQTSITGTQLNLEKLLTRSQVQAIFGISKRFLEVAAVRGDGPPFVKINRRVFYRYGDLLDWIDAHRVTSTSARLGQ